MLNTLVVGDLHADRKRKVTYGDSSIWDDRVFECLNICELRSRCEKIRVS